MRRSATPSIAPLAAVLLGLAAFAVQPAQAQQFEMSEEQFNSYLMNDSGGSSPQQFLETQLNGRLSRLDVTCDLSAQQRHKLELAGRGDIIRFQSQVAPLHDELVGKFFDQQQINDVFQRIQPLAQRVRKGVLDEGSLFAKVMAASLDDEQRTAYDRARAEQVGYQYRARLELFVASLDNSAPMLAKQREALLALLLKTTRPPKRWTGQYDWYYVLNQASRAPRDDVAKTLDAAQLRCFEAAVRQGAQFGPMLAREGMEPADEPLPADDDSDDDAADDPPLGADVRPDAAASAGAAVPAAIVVPINGVAVPAEVPILEIGP